MQNTYAIIVEGGTGAVTERKLGDQVSPLIACARCVIPRVGACSYTQFVECGLPCHIMLVFSFAYNVLPWLNARFLTR